MALTGIGVLSGIAAAAVFVMGEPQNSPQVESKPAALEAQTSQPITQNKEEATSDKRQETRRKREPASESFQANTSAKRSKGDAEGQLLEYQYTIEGVPSPKGAAFSPDGTELWVTSLMNEQAGVYVFGAASGEREAALRLPGGGGVEVAFGQDGENAYVSQYGNCARF